MGRLVRGEPHVDPAQVASLAGPGGLNPGERLPAQTLLVDVKRNDGERCPGIHPGRLCHTRPRRCSRGQVQKERGSRVESVARNIERQPGGHDFLAEVEDAVEELILDSVPGLKVAYKEFLKHLRDAGA
jgi:hypothetical protein